MASEILSVIAGKVETDEEIFDKIVEKLRGPYEKYLFRGVLYKKGIAEILLQNGVAYNFPDKLHEFGTSVDEIGTSFDALTYEEVTLSFDPLLDRNFIADYVGVEGYICVYEKEKFNSGTGPYSRKFVGENMSEALLYVFQIKSR